MSKYVAYFNNGEDFEYSFAVDDDAVKPEDRLEHVDERALKMAEQNGWGYAGVGPALEKSDFDFENDYAFGR